MILSCPGKTFLLGEYVALDGGPSILLSTGPRFRFSIRARTPVLGAADEPRVLPFHAESPAGLYYEQNHQDLDAWDFKFDDPYKGAGGLGASSAQFALLYAFHQSWGHDANGALDWSQVLRDYRAVAWNGEGVPPSGADVVSQLNGNVTYFDGRSMAAETLAWSFPELAFTIIRTGHKLATHEHLRGDVLAPHSVLRTIVIESRKAFAMSDEGRLIEAVNACSLALRQAGLTAPPTMDLLDQMRDQHELFWAAKGCGAMGADVIVALHSSKRTADVASWARGRGLTVAASLTDLSLGLELLQEVLK